VRRRAIVARVCACLVFDLNLKSDSLSADSAAAAVVENLLIARDLRVTSGICGDGGGIVLHVDGTPRAKRPR